MCWKNELYAAWNCLERAENHLRKAHIALTERALKRKATIERAKRSDVKKQAQRLYSKYSSAADMCMAALEYIKTTKKLADDVIQKATISRKKYV